MVREAAYGDRVRELVPRERHGRPVLVGGFHGSWATWDTVASLRLSVPGMRSLGTPLGAGVLLSLGADDCPVDLTRRVVRYLAGQSAGRCGPCFNGLPALAAAVEPVCAGRGGTSRVEELARLVVRRGACAHPDGTVRLVRSMLGTFAAEVAAHATGDCRWVGRARGRRVGGRSHDRTRSCGSTGRSAAPGGCATRCCPSWWTWTSGGTR